MEVYTKIFEGFRVLEAYRNSQEIVQYVCVNIYMY